MSRTIVVNNANLTNEQLAKVLDDIGGGAISVPAGVDIMSLPIGSSTTRDLAMDYAIKLIVGKGSNPNTNLVELAEDIYQFLKKE